MRLNVYLNAHGKREFVGLLQEDDDRRILFEYAREFLEKGIELSPFKLPLRVGVFEDSERTFEGLYGLFSDSLPDGWGCLLLDRKLRKTGLALQQITPLKRLSIAGVSNMGALEYEPCIEDDANTEHINLDHLATEANSILAGESSDMLEQFLTLNGSSGGARPKITVLVSDDKKKIVQGDIGDSDLEPWIIKFQSSLDVDNIGVQEYVISLLAKQSGINMPETYLFPSSSCAGHFGIKRFDRVGSAKVHMHTACGLLHASHRYPSLDYETLHKLTERLTGDVRDVEQMFRLMVFNVKVGNKDDHSKNFSYVMNSLGEWHLSPAYDITISDGISGEQTSLVNGRGRNILDSDIMEVGRKFRLPQAKMKEIIEQVSDNVAKYPTMMREYGVRV